MFKTKFTPGLRKSLLSLSLIFLVAFKGYSSDGDPLNNHIKRLYQIDQWGHTKWGLEYLPSDFYTSTQKYPVIVFFHGTGETGSSEYDLGKLCYNGPSNFIAYQNYNMQFSDPNTGESKKFIYVALQAQWWSPDVNEVWYVLKNNPRLKDRISNIFFTGLSAGGQQTLNTVLTSQEMSNGVTGIVPMSAAGWDRNGINFARNSNIKAWCFHGLLDNTCSYAFTKDFCDSLGWNRSRWTQLPVTHGNWNSVYTKDYRELINGKMMNIYEWMLSLIPVNTPPVANAGLDQFLTLPLTSGSLLGSGTDADGYITNYEWRKISGPTQFSIATPLLAISLFANLTPGTYQFELTVTDNQGATGKDTVTIIENNPIATIPIKLADFSVRESKEKNFLQWTSSNELNSDHFIIERSSNGQTFENIGKVNASGSSSIAVNYSFYDNAPVKGINYYRLKMVDKDGRSEYSKVISITSKGGQAITIVRSKISNGNNISLMVSSNETQTAQLSVVDAGGKTLLNTPVVLQKGSTTIEKNIAVSKGIYYIRLFTPETSVVKSLLSID